MRSLVQITLRVMAGGTGKNARASALRGATCGHWHAATPRDSAGSDHAMLVSDQSPQRPSHREGPKLLSAYIIESPGPVMGRLPGRRSMGGWKWHEKTPVPR